MQLERNFIGRSGTHAPRPLQHNLVRVKSDRGSYETQADAVGVYVFYGLPAGRYEFAPDLPKPEGTTVSWGIGTDTPPGPFPVHGVHGPCEERDIYVIASGSIQGRVIDSSDRPLRDALVYIVPAAEKVLPDSRQLYWESQRKRGFFKF